MNHKGLTQYLLSLTVFIACSVPGFAQGFRVESKSPAPPAGSETFTSLEGRFRITLPKQISGYTPQSANTPEGRIEGSMFNWNTAEGMFIVGYTERPEAVETMGKRALDILRDSAIAGTQGKGKLLGETDITLEGHPGRELRVEFPDGFGIARMYLVGRRIYQAIGILPTAKKAQEPAVLKILDSFKLLSPSEVEAELKRKIDAATPTPLPQAPVARRPRSDAEDDGLKGRVKTVLTETQDLSGTWAVGGRKPSSMDYYNEQGNLIKRESYDYRGNPSEITVYGYLDGDRVSNSGSLEYEYNPPAVMISAPAGGPKPTYDPRYSYKLKYKYDDQGRLREETWYGSDGKLWLRYVYNLKGNQKEALVYAADGSLNQKWVVMLDAQGNDVEKQYYDVKTNVVDEKYTYTYEFDAKGNWTKRTAAKWAAEDGKSGSKPYDVTYRTITYY